jgi:hypothetical protein
MKLVPALVALIAESLGVRMQHHSTAPQDPEIVLSSFAVSGTENLLPLLTTNCALRVCRSLATVELLLMTLGAFDGRFGDINDDRIRGAKRFFPKLLKKTGFVPRVIVTDKLKVRGSKKASDEECGTSTTQGTEQSSGKLSSADKNALSDKCGNSNHPASATISYPLWTDSRPLSPQATSTHRTTIPRTTAPTI